jgi:hypothetical protein
VARAGPTVVCVRLDQYRRCGEPERCEQEAGEDVGGGSPGHRSDRPIQRFQSGVVNDYVTWIVIGIACFGGALAFTIR